VQAFYTGSTRGISGGGVPPWPAANFHLREYPSVKTSYAPGTLSETAKKLWAGIRARLVEIN